MRNTQIIVGIVVGESLCSDRERVAIRKNSWSAAIQFLLMLLMCPFGSQLTYFNLIVDLQAL